MMTLLRLLIYVLSLSAAFMGGYRLTDVWFRAHLIPYPFQLYGIAAGLVLVFWSFSLLQLVEIVLSRLFRRKEANRPYVVKSKNKVNEVEISRLPAATSK